MNPFDIVNNINSGSNENLLEDVKAYQENGDRSSSDYNAFIINKAFSQFKDTIFYANEMNKHHQLPHKLQHDFLKYAIPPKKRFTKWEKSDKMSKEVETLIEVFDMSKKKAQTLIKDKVISKEKMDWLIENNLKDGK